MGKGITIYDVGDLVECTIKDSVPSDVEVSVFPTGINEIQAIVDGKKCIFTLTELMEQRYSAKGFINLIQGRIL